MLENTAKPNTMTIEFAQTNGTQPLNKEFYSQLLIELQPQAIETEEEYDRALEIVERLIRLNNLQLNEHKAILKLITVLIGDYESNRYPMEPVSPHEMLKHLMEAKGTKQADLVGMAGSKGVVSEIVSGKRSISKGQAKVLAAYFGVSVGLFI